MQATQSSYAMGQDLEHDSGNFAALRHVMRQMSLHDPEMPSEGRAEVAPVKVGMSRSAEVAEGAGLAHDAGNLLGALSLYSDLLAMPGVLHEEHREYAAELRMLSDRSWAMIDRLVNHARAGRAAKAGSGTSVLPDVVDRCKGLLSKIAGRKVEVLYGVGAFARVPVPEESVERILTNLVKNAAEATPWVGAISIDVQGVAAIDAEGVAMRRVVMTVRDRGCGMDSAAVRRLMGSQEIWKANGRGLGFRVVRELVAMSDGCLKIDSQLEVGTSISVEWYGVRAGKNEAQGGRGDVDANVKEEGATMVLEGEAGWMAC